MSESHEHRLKRIRIRAWRRGIKEMDLVVGGYADAHLASMDAAELDAFEALMEEADQDLLRWATGLETPPAQHAELLARMVAHAQDVLRVQ